MDIDQTAQPELAEPAVTIVYDGECPFCQHYVKLLRLRESAGTVNLIDARSDEPLASFARSTFDLNNGMAVRLGSEWHVGSDAIHVLGLLSSPSTMFNRVNFLVFSKPRLAKVLYPALRSGRNLTLRLLGRAKIE